MTITTGFLLYVTLFRLTVLAVGALMVYLGFRLFIESSKENNEQPKSSASAEGGGFKVTLTNFWPGTYFALFGTVVIGIMLWQGTPELIMKELKDVTDDGNGSGREIIKETLIRNSNSDTDIDQQWDKLSAPGLTLPDMAQPLSNIARIWQQQQGRAGEALAMARLAVKGEQDNPAYLALYAELLMESNKTKEAIRVMQVAVDKDPAYRVALKELQKQLGKLDN